MAIKLESFSKYERARIIGARALQLSMDAPLLMKIDEKELDAFNYDPLKLAEKELNSGLLPISINRPLPEKKEEKLKQLKLAEELEKDEKEERVKEVDEAIVPEEKPTEAVDMKTDEETEDLEEAGVEEAVEEDTSAGSDED